MLGGHILAESLCLSSVNFKISTRKNNIRDTRPDTENTDRGPDMEKDGPRVNQSKFRT